MSNKPMWSANGFARRVEMSEHDLWIIVEGRDHDRPHYERLIAALPTTKERKVAIRLAEQIEVNGVCAGGKDHAMALHQHLASAKKLTHKNEAGTSDIIFMVDRDRDDFNGSLSVSDHVFYTYGSDVEADILLNANIWSALSAAYGVDMGISQIVRHAVDDPISRLVTLWHDWLVLSLTALACDNPGIAPWGQLSQVNPELFSPADPTKVSEVHAKIQSVIDDAPYEEAMSKAADHVDRLGSRLLKGRWIARYIKYLVAEHLGGEIVRVNVPQNAVIDTALVALTYDGEWAQEYDARFAKILDLV